MKVENVKGPGMARSARKKQSNDSSGVFSSLLSDESAGAQPASSIATTSPIHNIGTMLELQEISDESARRKKRIEKGRTIIEYLEDLKFDLLDGKITPQKAKNLADEIRNNKEKSMDKELESILQQIEIRAAVELSKLDRQ